MDWMDEGMINILRPILSSCPQFKKENPSFFLPDPKPLENALLLLSFANNGQYMGSFMRECTLDP